MTRINVNPTRVSLFKLKRNLATAVRGHRLLKDKRDELMRRLLEIAKEVQLLRKKTNKNLAIAGEKLRLAAALMGEKELRETLIVSGDTSGCKVEFKNVMNVKVPEILAEDDVYVPEFSDAPIELWESVKCLAEIKKDLFRLAGLEKTAEIISAEIERIGRRVNALEYVLIPDYRETIAYIKMRLEENDRANSIRLLKVKDMVIKKK